MLSRSNNIPSRIQFSAKIDGWGFEDVDGKQTVIYSITVVSSNGCNWCVRRRYSEFRDNFLTIGFQFPKSKAAKFRFPRKTMFSSVNNADDRKDLLQKYLNHLLKIVPTPVEVQYFLRITRMSLGLEGQSATGTKSERGGGSQLSTPGQSPQRPDGYVVGNDSDDEESEAARGMMMGMGETYDFSTEEKRDSPTMTAAGGGDDSAYTPTRHADDSASVPTGMDGSSTGGSSRQSSSRKRMASPRKRMMVMRQSTIHTQEALRPYTMEHHLTLVDDHLVDEDELDHDPSKVLSPRVAVLLTVWGAGLCLVRAVCMWIHWKVETGYVFYSQPNILYFFNDWLYKFWYTDGHVKWMLKATIFWFVLMQTFHRIVGFILTEWVQMLICTPEGAFKMSFGSLVLRLGLIYNDNNEILVNEYVWHNPPRFRETPYFGRIKQLRIRFCFISLWRAVSQRSFIEVYDLEVEGLTIYMEKGKRAKDGLNLWACLGAENAEETTELRQGIAMKLASIVREVGGGVMHVGENVLGTVGDVAAGVFGGVKSVVGGVGRTAGHVGSSIGNTVTGRKTLKNLDMKSVSVNENGTVIVDSVEDEINEEIPSAVSDASRKNRNSVMAAAAAVANKIRHKNGSTEDAPETFNAKDIEKDEEELEEEWPELEFHWGVPYKFLVRRFMARDLTFYVKDFLAAKHTEHKPIVIRSMFLDFDELTGRPEPGMPHHMRQPLWLDDMLWRVINKLITELLKTNTIGLLATVAGSGFNQAADTAMNAAKSGGRQAMQSVYNYNPKEMANATVRGLHYLRYLGAPKFTRSPSIQDLKIDTLRVYLLAIRGLKVASGQAEDIMSILHRRRTQRVSQMEPQKFHVDRHTGHTVILDSDPEHNHYQDPRKDVNCVCTVKMELKNQPGKASEDQVKMFQYKSAACVLADEPDDMDRKIYEFGESFDIENLITLNAELYLRVFESSLIKDQTLGEVTLPLKDDFSALLDSEAGDVKETPKHVKDEHGNWVDQKNALGRPMKYLCGIREEKVGWYLLYAKGTNEIVGEVQLAMMLC